MKEILIITNRVYLILIQSINLKVAMICLSPLFWERHFGVFAMEFHKIQCFRLTKTSIAMRNLAESRNQKWAAYYILVYNIVYSICICIMYIVYCLFYNILKSICILYLMFFFSAYVYVVHFEQKFVSICMLYILHFFYVYCSSMLVI